MYKRYIYYLTEKEYLYHIRKITEAWDRKSPRDLRVAINMINPSTLLVQEVK